MVAPPAPCAVAPGSEVHGTSLSIPPPKPDLVATITIADAGQNSTRPGCSVAAPQSNPNANVKPDTNAHARTDATRGCPLATSAPAGARSMVGGQLHDLTF
ncbi:MAG: hypothetical protein JOZ09_05505 [Pseudonocardiales bacterium]|nr:hypothetical protein [Pseudonocardiales bacterium]